MGAARDNINPSAAIQKATARRVSCVSMPTRAQNMRHLAVHAMIFLHTRPQQMHVGQYFFNTFSASFPMIDLWSPLLCNF